MPRTFVTERGADGFVNYDLGAITDLPIEDIDYEKKPRSRSGTPNRSSVAAISSFLADLKDACPLFIGERWSSGTTVSAHTALAQVISALDFTPSTLAILADPAGLARKGYLVDTDLPRLTLRVMTEHCTKPMLKEIQVRAFAQEKAIVEGTSDGMTIADVPAPDLDDGPSTEIIEDEVLGRVQVDSNTGEILQVLTGDDADPDVLVDVADVLQVENTETAKQSNVWGSW